jgi:hypothetical protein
MVSCRRRLHRRGRTNHASPFFQSFAASTAARYRSFASRYSKLNWSRIFAFRWAWLGYPAVSPRRSGQWPRASAPVQRNICPQHIHSFERRNPPSFTDACCARIHRLARVFNSGAPARPVLTKPFLPPDEAVFVGPRKRPETGPAQHRRHGQTMRFDHVRVPEPALSCVLQSPLARDAKTIFGQLAPRPSTPSRGAIS